jgi:hypothetical protein
MPKYQAIYARTETKTIFIYCDAENEDQASEKFDEMVSNSIQQEGHCDDWIDFDAMECIDAEDYVQDIEIIADNTEVSDEQDAINVDNARKARELK